MIEQIWMRHAARLPPPPVFTDRRLLQLLAFWILQIAKWSIRVLKSAFFLFAFESCMFRQISVCTWCLLPIRFVSGDVGNLQVLVQKCVRKALTIMQQSIKIHAKSVQNLPKWCQGTLRKRPWKQVCSRFPKKRPRVWEMDAIFAPLGRFWVPFWPQLGAKGVPKSSIWASRRAQSRKNSFQEEV